MFTHDNKWQQEASGGKQMGTVRYNISQQYGVEKGVSLKLLCDKMPNEVYRKIMQSYVKSVVWRYKIIDDLDENNPQQVLRDIKILEVELYNKVATELIMEMIAGMFSGYYVVVFICQNEMAMGAAREKQNGKREKEIVATTFLQYDFSRKLTIIDYEKDSGKSTTEIFDRIMKEIRYKKKEIQMQDALKNLKRISVKKAVETETFSQKFIENIVEEKKNIEESKEESKEESVVDSLQKQEEIPQENQENNIARPDFGSIKNEDAVAEEKNKIDAYNEKALLKSRLKMDEFSFENLNRIRQDADFIQSRLSMSRINRSV